MLTTERWRKSYDNNSTYRIPISEKESSIHNLEEQLEVYHSENEQLQAELASLKEKCRELERSAAETQEKPVSATTTYYYVTKRWIECDGTCLQVSSMFLATRRDQSQTN